MSDNDLCSSTIGAHMINTGNPMDFSYRFCDARATVTAGTGEGDKIDSGFGNRHVSRPAVGCTGLTILSEAVPRSARGAILK
jgi:hypothetical protein